ncbi:dihydrolipoyl dehydrogenase [Massilia sp. YIM B02763]|uniref:dihydrolipoyl dehydrogenase n=1 Tax=Massilia sp. YIM B02763 TaxID=3050130 RepID=UPI0025B71A1C|nr:dihydrolipoyl dehydrogenase [Massilia sp. YIM B02763]MDN4053514.1 dihydrolipoyl dehydrogenase [Massilia sp. YIM B02763]
MKHLTVDVAIIGAGSAGMSAYRAARAHTDKVVVIESGHYGTTCARVGCMPSKLLIAAADAAHAVDGAHRFGVLAAPAAIDGQAVMRRVRGERDRFVGFVVDAVQGWPDEHRLVGHARFLSPHELEVGGHTVVTAGRIVIATGSSPAVPAGWREALGERLIVNDDVFAWDDLPESVAVAGPGVIGLELSMALARLGVRVRLFGRSSRVGPLTDPVVAAKARAIVESTVATSLDVERIEPVRDGDRVRLRWLEDGTRHEEEFDFLLAATGRTPNVKGLDLQRAGIEVDAFGIPHADRHTRRIGKSHIFIAGDAADEQALLHEAADEGRIAGDNAGRYPDTIVRPRRTPLTVVFSDPQIAIAGESHAQLLQRGADFASGGASFDDQGRSRVMGRNLGQVQVYGERGTGRFLGAEMIGPDAEHIGHLLSWSAQHGLTVQQMLDSPFYHPVVEEGLRTALRALKEKLALPQPPLADCLDCVAAPVV